MRQKNWKRPVLETLEDRLTPSSYNITGSGTTLTVTQTQSVSAGTTALTITDDPATGTITLADTGGTDTVTSRPRASPTSASRCSAPTRSRSITT